MLPVVVDGPMLLLKDPHAQSTVPRPDEVMALLELRSAIDRVLGSLPFREALIVRRYYGFEGNGCTYDELGRQLGISGGRIHQIMTKALSTLRREGWRCRLLRLHVVPLVQIGCP